MKKSILIALAALTALVSCNKETIESGNEGSKPVIADGSAFVALRLNLPTNSNPSTNANDVFDDGEGYEYTIENGTLVIFAGTDGKTEDELTLRSAYNLSHGQWNADGNTQITTTRTLTQEILTNNIGNGEKLYALIILNKHNFFSVEKSKTEAIKDVTTLFDANGDELTTSTFATFKKILLDEKDKNFSNQSFTMTNMPYVTDRGGKANVATAKAPKTLVEINPNAIYSTRQDAETHTPAAEINVERLVAKVSVNISNVTSLQSNNDVKLSTLGWFIDNTNPTTYVVRNVSDPVADNPYTYLTYNNDGNYRMVSGSFVRDGLVQARTYWGFDDDYNKDANDLVSEAGNVVNNELMNFNESHVNIGGRLRAAGSHYYCAENTFDVKHQTVKNTTRVIFAVAFNNGNDFYTLSTEQGTIRDEAAIKQYVADEILARVMVVNWLQKYLDSPSTATAEAKRGIFNVTVTPSSEKSGATAGKATVSIALAADGLDGLIADAAKRANAVTEWNTTLAADQTSYLNSNVNTQLNYYADGVAYYQALIRHFNNEETPWTSTSGMTNETESIYENNNENKYLGRYGVLRNNWYDINVTAIRQIGSSTVPELTDDPDDVVEQYISVKINIMPWAKRVQNVIL